MPKKLKLGMEVEDKVTGFKGIAIARTTYMHGCDRILVAPRVTEDHILPEAETLDELDLKIIGFGILPKPKAEEPGGPHLETSRAQAPAPRGRHWVR